MILILNAGSSTLKYKLFDAENSTVLFQGSIESIGEATVGLAEHGDGNGGGTNKNDAIEKGPSNHGQALEIAIGRMTDEVGFSFQRLTGIGHRIVHGGSELAAVELVTTSNAQRIRDLLLETIPLAPLHNPPAIQCFDAVRAVVPDCPNVLVFDTGFFRDLPDAAARYALPAWCLDEYKIRRYGAHGTSHRFVARRATELLLEAGIPYGKLITCHLGNGASMTAIREGRPLDTSMGLTPLEGLIMGTRSGDIDPAIIPFLQRHAKLDADGIDRLLNRESGLKGLCGDNDMRAIERRASVGDTSAELALEMFCQRIRKYVGAYAAVLGGLDALVFTAGIGQHSSLVRKLVCERLAFLGLSLDLDANDDGKTFITKQDSQVTAMVVATDEELAIYHEARSMLVNRA